MMLKELILIAASVCVGHLEPPDSLNHVPAIWGDVQYEESYQVQYHCKDHNLSDQVLLGCEWFDKDGWHARLTKDTPFQEACELRHALGHINSFIEHQTINPLHQGWTQE